MGGDLKNWFPTQPKWVQNAALLLLEKGNLDEKDLSDLIQQCLDEARGGQVEVVKPVQLDETLRMNVPSIRLCSLGNIEGINALSPTQPLDFGETQLCVVYGPTGSGKSGYVRILKHACGSRVPGPLLPNIYEDEPDKQQCELGYEKDGVVENPTWNPENGAIDDLTSVDVFDANCERIYVSGDHEVTYEPLILAFFSDLTDVLDSVASHFDSEIARLPSTLPELPSSFSAAKPGAWYGFISSETTLEEVEEICNLSDEQAKRLIEIETRLAESSPEEKAKQLRTAKEHVDAIVDLLETALSDLSDENCRLVLEAKRDYSNKREAARLAADELFNKMPVTGVGSDVWQLLWEHARQYSEESAYREAEFPYIGKDARCVLCQQELSADAKDRLTKFDSYVKGQARNEEEGAKQVLEGIVNEICSIPENAELKTKSDAAGFDEEATDFLIEAAEALKARKAQLMLYPAPASLSTVPECGDWISAAQERSRECGRKADEYDQSSDQDVHAQLKSECLELQARKWLAQNKQAILNEIKRQKVTDQLNAAKSLANTRALSVKKGDLSKELITDAFVKRFGDELKSLGAGNIKVVMKKMRVEKGHVLHTTCLLGARIDKPDDVLSEGERRIVSLSAFLADVAGKDCDGSFVFDDPVTSLDQSYEEAVASRLVELSKKSQVLVFTHRLTLLSLILEAAGKQEQECHVTSLRREEWGAGQPGEVYPFQARPISVLKVLRDQTLPRAQKVLNAEGNEAYYPHAKSLCSDFRSMIERLIEEILLFGIVMRNRRSIQTVGRLNKLFNIEQKDCTLLDDMMTKYSRYEHSQPLEAPIDIPSPEDIGQDLQTLIEWAEAYKKKHID